jgi:DNA-binding YbaB/EbfC family protein
MTDFDISAMMQQVQQMQERVAEMQKRLDDVVVQGSAGAGMVKVKATAAQRITSIEIDEAVMSEDREMLQDLVTAAVNNALDKAREAANEKAQEQIGGMLPPGLTLPGL